MNEDLFGYLVEASVYITAFYLFYRLFLAKDTFFRTNRVFLLSSLVISISVPLLNIEMPVDWYENEPIQQLNEVLQNAGSTQVVFPQEVFEPDNFTGELSQESSVDFPYAVYLSGVSVCIIAIIIHLVRYFRLRSDSKPFNCNGLKVRKLSHSCSPFSIFKTIYIDDKTLASRNIGSILIHENIHCRQLHSLDLAFVEAVKVLFWFNPFIYLYKHALKETHEYIADKYSSGKMDNLITYQIRLLQSILPEIEIDFACKYNSSFIKKRFAMLTKEKSSKWSRGKILLALPLTVMLFMFLSAPHSSEVQAGNGSELYFVDIPIPSICPIQPDLVLNTTSGFGERINPIDGKKHFHKGVDFAVKENTPVLATAAGEVFKAGYDDENGNFIVLRHADGYKTAYQNLARFAERNDKPLAVGDNVKKSEVIAFAGNTGKSKGPHLHYEVIKDNDYKNPANYYNMKSQDGDSTKSGKNDKGAKMAFVQPKADSGKSEDRILRIIFSEDSAKGNTDLSKPKIKSYKGLSTKIDDFDALYNKYVKPQAKTEVKEAVVELEITVKDDGNIGEIKVLKEIPLGYGYGDFLKEWIKGVQFAPAVKDKKRITSKTIEKITIK